MCNKYLSTPSDIFMDKNVRRVQFAKNSCSGGLPLYVDEKNFYVDVGDHHVGVIGAPGSGKSRCVIYPMLCGLINGGNSFFVSDCKGELLSWTHELLLQNGYDIVEYSFRKEEGDHLGFLYKAAMNYRKGYEDLALQELMDIAENLYEEVEAKEDPYWTVVSKQVFTALAIICMKNYKPEEVTIQSIYDLFLSLSKKRGGNLYLKEYTEYCDSEPVISRILSQYIDAPNDTRQSIFAVTSSVLSKYCISDEINSLLAGKRLSTEHIVNKKTAIFVICRDESSVYNPIISSYIDSLYCDLIKCADKNNGTLKNPFYFICDEFCNLTRIKDIVNKLSACRSRGIRWTLVLQSMIQLQTVYSTEESETLISLLTDLLYLYSPDYKMNINIEKRIGTKIDEYTGREVPLISASELQYLNAPLLLFYNHRPFVTKLLDKDEFNKYYGLPSSSDYKIKKRRRLKKPDTSRIIEKIDENRRKKMGDMMFGEGPLSLLEKIEKSEKEKEQDKKRVDRQELKDVNKDITERNKDKWRTDRRVAEIMLSLDDKNKPNDDNDDAWRDIELPFS